MNLLFLRISEKIVNPTHFEFRGYVRGGSGGTFMRGCTVRVSYRVTLEIDQLSQPFNPRNNALRMIILVSVRIKALRIRKSSHCVLKGGERALTSPDERGQIVVVSTSPRRFVSLCCSYRRDIGSSLRVGQ